MNLFDWMDGIILINDVVWATGVGAGSVVLVWAFLTMVEVSSK